MPWMGSGWKESVSPRLCWLSRKGGWQGSALLSFRLEYDQGSTQGASCEGLVSGKACPSKVIHGQGWKYQGHDFQKTVPKLFQVLFFPPRDGFFFFFLILIFTLFYFTILYWFCHTLTWIHHRCTCVPKHEPPSHLPPHNISLGMVSNAEIAATQWWQMWAWVFCFSAASSRFMMNCIPTLVDCAFIFISIFLYEAPLWSCSSRWLYTIEWGLALTLTSVTG